MGLTDHLTEEQRRQRIAKILLRGAFLLAKKEGWLKASADGDGNRRRPGESSVRVPCAGDPDLRGGDNLGLGNEALLEPLAGG
jgi:hypothetical protein